MDVKCQNRQRLYTIEDLENLLEYVPYEIWLKDKDGRHVYINQKGANKLGLKKEDIIGKTDMEIRSKEFWEKCKLTDDQVIQEKKALFYEDEFDMNKDNCYRVYKFPIKDSEDNVKLTGGLANEVIYSKYINKELEDLFSEAQKSENENIEHIQSISRVLSNLNNMIKSTSIDLFCIDESKERLNLYISCDKKNIFLKNSSINIDYKEFSKLYDNKLKIDINNKLNYEFRKIYDPQVEINENSIFKVIPLKIDGRLIGVIYIYYENKDECVDTYDWFIYDVLHRISNFFTNIELKNELKEKLYKSQERAKNLEHEIDILEEAIESEMVKVNFLENMSHEFKTPINIILMISKLLLSSIENNDFNLDREKIINYLKILKQNGYRILRLVNNIVDSTRIGTGVLKAEFGNYEIVSIIEDIVISTVPFAQSKNINIVFDTYIEELEIRCDPESIERVILNLLSNAIKFTNNDGNISVIVEADDKYVFIRVKDDGIGISKDIREDIFNRFVQEDKSLNRKNEGSGIGLALVKSLVELHDGEVYLEDVSEGSEFVVKLPNIKINEEVNNHNRVMDVESKPLVQKINIEFSDIYSI